MTAATFRCRLCPEVFPNPRRLRNHHADMHPKPARERSDPPPPVRVRTKPSLKRDTDTWPKRG